MLAADVAAASVSVDVSLIADCSASVAHECPPLKTVLKSDSVSEIDMPISVTSGLSLEALLDDKLHLYIASGGTGLGFTSLKCH